MERTAAKGPSVAPARGDEPEHQAEGEAEKRGDGQACADPAQARQGVGQHEVVARARVGLQRDALEALDEARHGRQQLVGRIGREPRLGGEEISEAGEDEGQETEKEGQGAAGTPVDPAQASPVTRPDGPRRDGRG
jgi:hypothetical protein